MRKPAARSVEGAGDRPAAGGAGATLRAVPDPVQPVEASQALVVSDFTPPAVTAGERLIRLAYGLGVSGQLLTSPFHKPPKTRLLATVLNPLPGDKVAGTALRAGFFLAHGAKLPVAQVEFAGVARMTPPFDRLVHGFAWLGDLDAAGTREQCAPVAEALLAEWLAANPTPPSRPGKLGVWSVESAGQRLLNWLVHAPLILSGNDKTLRKRALVAFSDHARWLDRHAPRASGRGEDALARLAAWSAVLAAGLLLPAGRPRRLFGEAGLMKVLGELVGDDGGVLARGPLAQMEAIACLVKLGACYRATRADPPEAVQGMLALLVPPLLALTHADGSLGSWQGGWAVEAVQVARLVEASGVRARPLRDPRQWGYQRVTARQAVLQFDAAPPPLARHARHGCASTLAFEFSHAGQRLVVNCGGAAAAGGTIPARLEQGLRATAAHSTLVLDDINSTAVLINGRIGSGVSAVESDRRAEDGVTRLEASHNGYGARYGLTHRRTLALRDDGGELVGMDELVPARGKGSRGKVPCAIRFHLGPGIEAGVTPDGQGVGLALPDGSYWRFRIETEEAESQLGVEDSLWADGQGRPVAIRQIVVQGLVSRRGGGFAWSFKRIA